MANLFNSNPLLGLGLALSTFGGEDSIRSNLNLLNFARMQQEMDDEKSKDARKENASAAYLKNTGGLTLKAGAEQSRPLTIGERVFNGFNDQTDTSQVDLMNAAGAGNLLNSKLASIAKANEPYDLAPGAIRMQGNRVIGRNDKPPEIPADAALVKYFQTLPPGPERDKLGQIIQQKTNGPAKSVWKTLSAADAMGLGLPAGGTYQQDQNGQVQVITQPKQDNPTEGQEKFAFNADRVGSALGAVKEVLSNNPSAASNFWLDATNGVPGLDAAGRRMVNDDAQIVRNNLGDAIDAIITLGTGAAYTEEQLKAQRNKYLPRPGESPKVIKSKFDALASVYENAKKRARTAGRDLPDVSEFAGIYGIKPAGASGKWGADVDALLNKYAPR